jgi:hypothetical protein
MYLGISLTGLVPLAVIMYVFPASENGFMRQTQLTGIVFALICLFGIVAALFPSRCLRITHFKKNMKAGGKEEKGDSSAKKTVAFEGHHPVCGNFSSHVFYFGGEAYCAGCTGLATGAILSLAGSCLYFFAGLGVGETGGSLFWLGFFGATCGLLQYKFQTNSSYVHFFLNVVFVLGAFLLLVGVDAAKEDLTVNAYFLALVVYWIAARIVLSQTEHRRICRNCEIESCNVSFSN